MTPLARHRWSAADLHARHPVRFHHPYKARIHAGCRGERAAAGEVVVTRWAPAWPDRVADPRAVRHCTIHGPFAYDDPPSDRSVWYPNFADPDLFAFWDGPLLAQDELQALEHPTLGAIREALVAEGHAATTVDADGRPTPFLIEGLRRVCAVDVMPCPERPHGLYGNRFQGATWSVVEGAVRAIEPATETRLFAMSAPYGGRGAYTTLQIRWILEAAFTAMAAAVTRSEGAPVTLHTGFWGCGAFGGDRVLMVLAQWIAAAAAGVHEVVFHTLDPRGRPALDEAGRILAGWTTSAEPEDHVLALHGLGRRWGVGDGN